MAAVMHMERELRLRQQAGGLQVGRLPGRLEALCYDGLQWPAARATRACGSGQGLDRTGRRQRELRRPCARQRRNMLSQRQYHCTNILIPPLRWQGEEHLVLRASADAKPFSVTLRPAPPGMVAPRPGGLPAYEVELPVRVLYVQPTRALGGMLLEVRGG